MKISNDNYEEMKEAISNIVRYFGTQELSIIGPTLAWELFHRAAFDFMNDDTHPFYKLRQRINPYKPGWQMYPEGINDSHWQTAINKIMKELSINHLSE